MDYEKILKRIVQIINTTENSYIGFTNICTYIGENCPELQESEDERIRKELIDYINRLTVTPNNIDRYNSWIAWLEKQAQSTTIIIPKDLKGTDTDGGVVGEKGEQGEQPTEEEMVGMGGLGKVWSEQAIISRLDRIIELLERPIIMPCQQPLQPLQPLYDTNKIYCDTASTEGGKDGKP